MSMLERFRAFLGCHSGKITVSLSINIPTDVQYYYCSNGAIRIAHSPVSRLELEKIANERRQLNKKLESCKMLTSCLPCSIIHLSPSAILHVGLER